MMKNLKLIYFLSLAVIISLSSCSNDNELQNYEKNNDLLTYKGKRLAENMDALKHNLNPKDNLSNIEISYHELPANLDGLYAEVEYTLSTGEQKKTLIIRGVPKIKYNGTVGFNPNEMKNSDPDDIYISCSGSNCCYPQGTFNLDTGEMTTSCRCEGDSINNSSCVMKISKKKPNLIKP